MIFTAPTVPSPPKYNRSTSKVRVEISAERLANLLACGQLSGGEFRCLDCNAKHCVKEILLANCAQTIAAR